MGQISEEQVRHVALLSRLELTDDEVRHFTHDLSSILGYVAKLDELDTSEIAPMSHPLRLENSFREDTVGESLTNEQALANAPDAEAGLFKVPPVIQDGGGA
mgnify:CR=1 FL=1